MFDVVVLFVKADGLLAGGMFALRLIIERTYTCERGVRDYVMTAVYCSRVFSAVLIVRIT